jgi:hypothetical protein
MKKQILKFFPDKSKGNILVEVDFLIGNKNRYKCVGVLMNETTEKIRIGFNAKDNVVEDYLDINAKDIINVREIDKKEIKKIF